MLAAKVPYRETVGALMHLMCATRPDIAFAAGMVARFMEAPQDVHWTAVKRIFRYLQGTKTHGVCFARSNDNIGFEGYSDADWTGDVSDQKSTSGYLFKLAGDTISWGSKKQTSVSLSTSEAEYIALSLAIQESKWIHRFLCEILIATGTTHPNSCKVVATADFADGLYWLCVLPSDLSKLTLAVTQSKSALTSHARMGHASDQTLQQLVKCNMVKDTEKLPKPQDGAICHGYQQGKMMQKPFKANREKRTFGVFELIHFDIFGPMEVPSIGGSKYLLLIVDEASGSMKGFCLRNKSESEELVKNFIVKVGNQFAKKVKFVCHDGAKEFATKPIKSFYAQRGIEQQVTVPYVHQANGTAERAI